MMNPCLIVLWPFSIGIFRCVNEFFSTLASRDVDTNVVRKPLMRRKARPDSRGVAEPLVLGLPPKQCQLVSGLLW